MKSFLAGFVAMIVISVGAGVVLTNMDFSSAGDVTSERGSVRLGENP
jgi:hypothetical protein